MKFTLITVNLRICMFLGFLRQTRDSISVCTHGVPTLQVDLTKCVVRLIIHALMTSHDLVAATSQDAMLTCITIANLDAGLNHLKPPEQSNQLQRLICLILRSINPRSS